MDALLQTRGIKPMKDRMMKIHQCVVAWFHPDEVPDLNELVRVVEELTPIK